MADRYLRATGNWNGAVWAATSGGAAGSAATPTINDEVVISSNFIVTLTGNSSAATILHTNGQLRLGGHKLTVDASFVSSGSTARTVDLQGGSLEFTGNGLPQLTISGSNLTWSASNSLIVFNQAWSLGSTSIHFATDSKSFGDVVVNMGANTIKSTTFNITGSPTFRSLIIQSKNSAAHTVEFDNSVNISVEKLVLIGASSSNKLTIQPQTYPGNVNYFINVDSSYGQFVNIVYTGGTAKVYGQNLYIGSNSTNTLSIGWTFQDPPKISTLVDPLTTAPGSNANWRTTGTITQVYTGYNGGGYTIAGGASLTSTDTYDLVDSSLVFQRVGNTTGIPTWKVNDGAIEGYIDGFSGQEMVMTDPYNNIDGGGVAYSLFDITSPVNKFVKISLSSSTRRLSASVSDDGVSWTEKGYYVLPTNDDLLYFRSVRLGPWTGGNYTIGAFNPTFSAPSTGNFLQFFGGY